MIWNNINNNNNTTTLMPSPQSGMFFQATSFNQPLDSWDVSSGTDFVSEMIGAMRLFLAAGWLCWRRPSCHGVGGGMPDTDNIVFGSFAALILFMHFIMMLLSPWSS
jgi:hypothetical protein